MKCNIKGARGKRLADAYHTIGSSILSYLDASTGCIVTELYGYKKNGSRKCTTPLTTISAI